MKRSVESKVSHVKCNRQQLLMLKLLDESTNIEYTIEVGKEDYDRAYNDNKFANMLLEKAITLNSKDKHESSYPSTSSVPSIIIDNQSNETWTHEATLFLISLYKENSYMLGKFPHKKIWTKICQNMKQKINYNFTVNQCYNKMDTLKRRYRQIVDHNAQSGNDRKEWIYLEPLEEIFCNKPWIKPLSTAGSNIQEPKNHYSMIMKMYHQPNKRRSH